MSIWCRQSFGITKKEQDIELLETEYNKIIELNMVKWVTLKCKFTGFGWSFDFWKGNW